MFSADFIEQLATDVATKVIAQLATSNGPQQRLLTVDQAAEYIGRSRQATYHLISQDKIPVKRQGGRVFIDRLALDTWIDELAD